MSHTHRSLLLAALLATPVLAQVDDATAAAIKKEGLENSQVMAILDRLTNGIGHRLTGSANFTRACAWAKEEFEAMGLDHVELERWDVWPVGWNRGQWSGRILVPEEIELQVATEAWTNGTKGRVRGRVLAMPKDAAALDALGESMRGAWLFGDLPASREPFHDVLVQRAEAAGIAGFLHSSRGDERYPTRMRVFGTQNRPRTPELPDDPPSIMIRSDQAAQIAAMLEAGQEVVAEFDIRNRWREGPIDVHNVIAEIRGTEKPEEIVVVGGHLDSWHQATGTTDNGTGTASTMEAARILTAIGAKPKRTIRFALWGGEEQGLLGSRGHVVMHREEMPQVSAVFNHDTGTNWAQSLTVSEAMVPLMEKVLAPVMTMQPPDDGHQGPVFELHARPELRGGRGGSDHASFLAAGVPAFSWGLTGRSDYFRYTWHTQWDTYDVAIPEYMRHTSTVVALTALGLANADELLTRDGLQRPRGDDLEPQLEGRLGVELGGEGQLLVQSVREDGPAAKAGVKAGDRILAIGGRSVDGLVAMSFALRRASRGSEPVAVRVQRGEEELDLHLPANDTAPAEAGGEPRRERVGPGRRNADR